MSHLRTRTAIALFLAFVLVGASIVGLRAAAASSIGTALPGATIPMPLRAAWPANGSASQGITVTGQGEASAQPDIAYINLGVASQGATAKDALAANSTAMNAVLAAVKGQGIADKDIQTSNLSITPIQSQQSRGSGSTAPKIVGYQVSNSVAVTVHTIAHVGPVIDAAVAAGANVAGGVQFAIAHPAALQEQALAAAAHVSVSAVLDMTESSASYPRPYALASPALAQASSATPIQAGTLKVTAQVVVRYAFQ